MKIIICGRQGTGKSAVAEALRDFFIYRGTACYVYDYLNPLVDMCNAVYIAGSHHGLQRPCASESMIDPDLLASMYTWTTKNALIPAAASRNISDVTSEWDRHRLFYVAIVDGVVDCAQLSALSGFRVYLHCEENKRISRVKLDPRGSLLRENDHPLEVGFNDCAESNIFDLVVDTSKSSPEEIATLIGTKFLDKLDDVFKQTDASKNAEDAISDVHQS